MKLNQRQIFHLGKYIRCRFASFKLQIWLFGVFKGQTTNNATSYKCCV